MQWFFSMEITLLKVFKKNYDIKYLQQYLFKRYGFPILFFKSVSPGNKKKYFVLTPGCFKCFNV